MVCVRPGEVAGEGDRRAELAQRPGPAQHRAGGDARGDQRQRDPAERRPPAGAEGRGGLLEPGVGGPQRALDADDQERHRHERLGDHDGGRGERHGDAERLVQPARRRCPCRPSTRNSATPPTTGGSTSGTVTSARSSGAAAEARAGQHPGQRHARAPARRSGREGRRDQRQPQRLARRRARSSCGPSVRPRRADQQPDQRQHQEGDADAPPGRAAARGTPRAPSPGAASRRAEPGVREHLCPSSESTRSTNACAASGFGAVGQRCRSGTR